MPCVLSMPPSPATPTWRPPFSWRLPLMVIFLIGLLGDTMLEQTREWFSRLGAWMAIAWVLWVGLKVLIFHGPDWVNALFNDFQNGNLVSLKAWGDWPMVAQHGGRLSRRPESGYFGTQILGRRTKNRLSGACCHRWTVYSAVGSSAAGLMVCKLDLGRESSLVAGPSFSRFGLLVVAGKRQCGWSPP